MTEAYQASRGRLELSPRTLLLVDDDHLVLELLESEFIERGFEVLCTSSVQQAQAQIASRSPRFAVIDLKLSDGSGFEVLEYLKEQQPDAKAVILTGYGDLRTAVSAVKIGAVEYLTKPVDPGFIVSILLADGGAPVEPPKAPLSADRARWEHIHRIFEACDRNVSETARRLGMHRRTLQRMLAKRAPH